VCEKDDLPLLKDVMAVDALWDLQTFRVNPERAM
jgi:hypothetical protein